MKLTLREALKLNIMKKMKLIVGEKGIKREITKVGILDYEMDEVIVENFNEGEFALSTLVSIKDDISKLYSMVEKLIEVKASGLAIKSIFFDRIPDDVYKVASKNEFPIFIFNETYFEDIITEINNEIYLRSISKNVETKIDKLINESLSKFSVRSIAKEINSEFNETHIVGSLKLINEDKYKSSLEYMLNLDYMISEKDKLVFYKDKYFFIKTFENNIKEYRKNTESMYGDLVSLGFKVDDYIIAFSDMHSELAELDISLNESLYALDYLLVNKEKSISYREIGMNKFLLALKDNEWIEKYYYSLIAPILKYDKENNSYLLETLDNYIRFSSDVKKTAEYMHQHGNTIRYRITKIKELVKGVCSEETFLSEYSIIINLYRIYNKGL
ncbi:PucR family transcriptional regulator [Helicovermis profundi]|uniref:PucR family transcriptional regulator n=1 Tax=Helicovermis profundi TaxID=3065157 RepID=A0AAU9EKP9_9FIRM|nr:hypothetical protein HLPR_01320 [Clostridia bacterium S502]